GRGGSACLVLSHLRPPRGQLRRSSCQCGEEGVLALRRTVVSKGSGLQDGLSLTCPRTLRAATRTCSRSHACAGSFVRRGCQLMKYGNGLSSRGGSIVRKTRYPLCHRTQSVAELSK